MIRKISLFLAKIFLILILVITGSVLVLPQTGRAESDLPEYTNLIFNAFDPKDQLVNKVYVQAYEQITDANNNPALGKRWASGRTDETGTDIIKIKNPFKEYSNECKQYAVKYFMRDNPHETFTQWDQCLYAMNDSATSDLTLSSAKVVLTDPSNNLLKDQSFDVYSGAKDAKGNLTPFEKIYGGQKTGALGYKNFYLNPGDYFIKAKKQEFPFKIFKDTQTDVLAKVIPDAKKVKTGPTYADLTLYSKDAAGDKVTGVTFSVYKQEVDSTGKPVLGKKLAGGKIGDLGFKTVKIRNDVGVTLPIAVLYYKNNKEAEKFYLYNQQISGIDPKTINLVLSSVKITLKAADGSLLKQHPYDIYLLQKNSKGELIATKKLYGNQKTGDFGAKLYYFAPNEYAVLLKYNNSTDLNNSINKFTISANSAVNYTYTFGSLKITVRDINGALKPKALFKIYRKDSGVYKEIISASTDSDGAKTVNLPAGDYRADVKGKDGKYVEFYEFALASGQKREIAFNSNTFTFKLLDAFKNPMGFQEIKISKYANNTNQGKVFQGKTNSNGEITLAMPSGSYIADVVAKFNGLNYQSKQFYVQENYWATYQYVLSVARINLVNSRNQSISNQKFILYTYGVDANGKMLNAKQLGKFTANSSGYEDIFLPGNKYIIKMDGKKNIYAITVESEKFNDLYLTIKDEDISTAATLFGTVSNPTNATSAPTVKPATTTVKPAASCTVKVAGSENLYSQDSDKDSLADFDEIYIWKTNPLKADSDGDGYADALEIRSGYNPNGSGRKTYTIWAYGQPRVSELCVEQQLASYLKSQISKKLGYTPKINDQNWNTIIKSYIYGGYTITEIKDTIVNGPGKVHPTIPAWQWR